MGLGSGSVALSPRVSLETTLHEVRSCDSRFVMSEALNGYAKVRSEKFTANLRSQVAWGTRWLVSACFEGRSLWLQSGRPRLLCPRFVKPFNLLADSGRFVRLVAFVHGTGSLSPWGLST